MRYDFASSPTRLCSNRFTRVAKIRGTEIVMVSENLRRHSMPFDVVLAAPAILRPHLLEIGIVSTRVSA